MLPWRRTRRRRALYNIFIYIVFQDIIYTQRYVALATYEASESSEATIQEGDMCEVLQIGSKGWWFIRNLASMEEGWAPASFLDCAKRSSTYSAQSTLSSGSTGKVICYEGSHWLWALLVSPHPMFPVLWLAGFPVEASDFIFKAINENRCMFRAFLSTHFIGSFIN